MKKGQVSLEFMVFFGLLLLITTVASGIALSSTNQINNENTARDAKTITRLVATEINIAYEVGDGYSHNFTINPVLMDGSGYNITVLNQTVYLSWRGGTYLTPVLTYNVAGNFTKGRNLIRNIGGVLNVTKA